MRRCMPHSRKKCLTKKCKILLSCENLKRRKKAQEILKTQSNQYAILEWDWLKCAWLWIESDCCLDDYLVSIPSLISSDALHSIWSVINHDFLTPCASIFPLNDSGPVQKTLSMLYNVGRFYVVTFKLKGLIVLTKKIE